ncbi:iron-sulfur cluster repair di-iron protein [Marinicrinis sediminis]|uniref:Iron-sulfur cluster repair di-iron protein n=1 Tax=Marinicrinis sediminis TaxID=1652465 RepID=A0ABW5R8B3_9BACL
MTTFTLDKKIGDIVTAFPGASNVFKAHQIDFCCGGQRPLREAIEDKQLDGEQVLGALDEAYRFHIERQQVGEQDWKQASFQTLIDHIVSMHHEYVRRELPIISQFVTKVMNVHGIHYPDMLPPLHRMFHELKMELEQHLMAEEQILFPLVIAYEQSGDPGKLKEALAELDRLEADHSGAGDLLKEMRKVTSNYTLPEGACRTFTLTFEKLEQLEADMFEHIHLENNILFVRLAELDTEA